MQLVINGYKRLSLLFLCTHHFDMEEVGGSNPLGRTRSNTYKRYLSTMQTMAWLSVLLE